MYKGTSNKNTLRQGEPEKKPEAAANRYFLQPLPKYSLDFIEDIPRLLSEDRIAALKYHLNEHKIDKELFEIVQHNKYEMLGYAFGEKGKPLLEYLLENLSDADLTTMFTFNNNSHIRAFISKNINATFDPTAKQNFIEIFKLLNKIVPENSLINIVHDYALEHPASGEICEGLIASFKEEMKNQEAKVSPPSFKK